MGRPRGLLTYFSVLCAGGVIAVALPALASGTTRAAAPGVYPKHNARVVGAAVVNFAQLARLEKLHRHVGPGRPGSMPEPQEIPEPNMRQLTLPSPFGSLLLSAGSLTNAPSPTPVQSFIAQADAPRPSSGYSFIPPDTNGAVGATKMMSTLNSNYVVEQKSNGAVVGSAVGMDTFWSAAGATSPFDPKTFYDPYSQRWIVAAVDAAGSAGSGILYGISDSSDPSGTWHLYKLDVDSTDATWADYPGVGFNKNFLVITVNMFDNASNAYAGKAKVYAINYPQLRSGTNGAPAETDVSNGFTIQPAVTYSPTENTLYMVEHGTSASGVYYFYTVSSAGTVAGGTTAHVNPLGGWVVPGSANVLPQSGGHGIDTGDSRILNAVFRNGNIYYAQTVGLGGSNFSPARTGVQWVEVNTSGAFVQGGRIVDPAATSSNGGRWYAYPSIAVNQNNDVMVGFSAFRSNGFPQADYAVHFSTDAPGTMRDPGTLKAGEGNYFKQFNGTRNRWGDYSATQVDPADDMSFWTTQEYSRPTPAGCSSSGTITCGAWGTWWGKVPATPLQPPSCVVAKVVGKKLAAAKTAIKAGHCKVGKVSYIKSTRKKKGRVIKQRPGAGKTLASGSKVNLWVGKGAKKR